MRQEMNVKDIIPMSVVESLLLDPQRNVKTALQVRSGGGNIMNAREFGRTMYLVYEGQLRQFKIKKGMKFPFNYTPSHNGESFQHVLILDIAGIGECAVKADMYNYQFAFHIYNTIEDFKDNKPYQLSRKYLDMDKLGEIYSNVGTMAPYKPLVRYIWNGTSAQSYSLKDNVSLFFTYNENGFDNQMVNEDYSGYANKEECERDNAIQVAVFADEEEKEDEVAQEVIVRCSIEINGVEYDVVNEETLAAIRKILNY